MTFLVNGNNPQARLFRAYGLSSARMAPSWPAWKRWASPPAAPTKPKPARSIWIRTQHTLGLVGQFVGVYGVEGDTLTINLADPGAARPASLEGKNKRLYKKIG